MLLGKTQEPILEFKSVAGKWKKDKEAGPHSVSSLYGSVLASSLTWLTHVALHLQALIAFSSLASLPWLLSQQALHG